MDSDSEQLYRSQSPITKLCEILNSHSMMTSKIQKCDSNPRISKNTADDVASIYDPTSLCDSHPLTNPFTNNWREYDSQHPAQFLNSTPSFKEESLSPLIGNRVVEIIQQIYEILMAASAGVEQKLIDCIQGCSTTDLENVVMSAQGSKLMQDVLK